MPQIKHIHPFSGLQKTDVAYLLQTNSFSYLCYNTNYTIIHLLVLILLHYIVLFIYATENNVLIIPQKHKIVLSKEQM